MFRVNDTVRLNPDLAAMAKVLGFGFDPDKDYKVRRVHTEYEPRHRNGCANRRACDCLAKLANLALRQNIQLKNLADQGWYHHSWFIAG